MWRDVQYGLRQIRRNKLFSAIIVLILCLGIGANTVIFSFVNSLLLSPLPVRAPRNLYLIEKMRTRQVRPDTSFFYRQFHAIAQQKKIFSATVAEQAWAGNSFQAFSNAGSTRLVATQIVSPNYFSELGAKPVVGRLLTQSDASASSNIPVVLSYQFWSSQFHRDPAIIGKTVRVRNYPFLVVGILPREFHSIDIDRAPDVRFPISAAPMLTGSSVFDPGGDYPIGFQVLARLAPGVSPARAAAALLPPLQAMEDTLWRAWYVRSSKPYPQSELEEELKWERSYRLELLSAARGVSQLREQFTHAVALLMGAVAMLLLAVCANVGGLLLAKSEERSREIAVRLSVGATRSRLLRQLLIENLLLALPSAALALSLAYLLAPWLVTLLPVLGIGAYSPPVVLDVTPDTRVLLFAIAISFATVLLFGMAPARHALTLDLNDQLKAHARTSAAARSGTAMIAIQVALAVCLVSAATVMLRTFWNLQHLNPGFDRAHVIEISIDPWDLGWSESQASALLRQIKQRANEIPGVRAVSFAGMGLMRGIGVKTTVVPAGSALPAKTFLNTSFNRVTADYFESLGIPLLAGRNLNRHDINIKPIPIVVNRAFAKYFFPRRNPIGKRIVSGVDGSKPPMAIIVGVVGTAKYRSLREHDPPIYYAISDDNNMGSVMYVRTYTPPKQVINSIRTIFTKLAPTLPLAGIFTLEQEVENSIWQERLVTMLCAFFGLTALLLCAVGLYGVLAYSVARRSRELSIRVAIGAQVKNILETLCLRLALAVGLGLLIGSLCAAVLMRLARSLAFGMDPDDPLSFVAAVSAILLFASLAAAAPALRAARTDPALALRAE